MKGQKPPTLATVTAIIEMLEWRYRLRTDRSAWIDAYEAAETVAWRRRVRRYAAAVSLAATVVIVADRWR